MLTAANPAIPVALAGGGMNFPLMVTPASPIHDHGGQHCWMLVLDGSLEVEDYVRVDAGDVPGHAEVSAAGSRTLRTGSVDLRSGRFDLHRVSAAEGPAVSLHLYAGPLNEYLVYDENARRCQSTRGTYDAVLSVFTEPLLT